MGILGFSGEMVALVYSEVLVGVVVVVAVVAIHTPCLSSLVYYLLWVDEDDRDRVGVLPIYGVLASCLVFMMKNCSAERVEEWN